MLEDRWWPGVCQAIDEPDLENDPRFESAQTRFKNRDELTAHLDEVFARRPAREWVRRFQEHDLMAAPVQDYEELVNDPQVLANDYIQEVECTGHGTVRMVGVPIRFGETPGEIRGMAPALGDHTHEVLLECGLTQGEIDQLEGDGVIRQDRSEAG
jgi:CoA:oxalate CoA-transferase